MLLSRDTPDAGMRGRSRWGVGGAEPAPYEGKKLFQILFLSSFLPFFLSFLSFLLPVACCLLPVALFLKKKKQRGSKLPLL
ncbi:MAG: hypothetical protein F6K31_00175 [Symploca sp. SIO2G7]|nr:hypothetical protein [Symploca sp. SIO2G7]